jgi:hypothetical protein
MKQLRHIIYCLALLPLFACSNRTNAISAEETQQAQNQYDSGVVCLQNDSLMEALPHFFEAANSLERLPEDMTKDEMLLTSKAYFQMANVFRPKMETNAEIDALRQALRYQTVIPDTAWIIKSSLQLADALEVIQENDSALFYLNCVMPLIDTISGDVEDYISAQFLLSCLYYDKGEIDSCVMVQKQIIDFKARRGMDTKNDSVGVGINLFFANFHVAAKPYLLKVMEADFDDVKRGAVMSLLGQIYEEENQPDSAAMFHVFSPTYVQAESERVSDGMLAVKQYEQFKAERDARLQALREQKALRKRMATLLWSGLVLMVLAIVVVAIVKRRRRRNASFEAGWAQFEQSDIFVRIRERLAADAPKISSKNVEDFSHLALSQADFTVLKDAVDAAFGGFATRLSARYPDLSTADLNACCLALTGLSHAEMAVLQGVKYNSFTNRITKIKKTLGTEESLSACLKNMLKEG